MSELDEVLSGEADAGWVDEALFRAQSVSNATLAELDLSTGFDDMLAHIWRADATGEPDKPRGRRRRVVVTLAVTGALLSTGGVAAALGVGGALTGLFGKPGNTENDTSQYVDASKPDFPQLAQQWATQLQQDGLRFAPGYVPQKNIDSAITSLQRSSRQVVAGRQVHSLIQVTGVKGRIADVAACTWESSWLIAHQQHDQAGMRASVAGMHQTAGLKIMSKINEAKTLTEFANAADHGDASRIQTDVDLNCSTVVK